MLAILGTLTVVVLLALILTKRLNPLSALIIVPVMASLIGGFGAKTAVFMLHGVQSVAGVAGMFIFAILYFGIVSDAGMLKPIIERLLKAVGNDPARIAMGTALLALLVHLDGSGAVTFLVTIPVMRPLFERTGMDRRVLACAASMAAGVNFLPWTGPMIRASSVLHVPAAALFNALLPVQIVGLIFVFAATYWMGRRERARIGTSAAVMTDAPEMEATVRAYAPSTERPRRFVVNLLLTAALLVLMIGFNLEPMVVFMLGLVIALQINYPNLRQQQERIDAHGRAALLMASILLAAGAFTGIMKDSGMLAAMANAAVALVPHGSAGYLPVLLAVLAMPLSLIFDPDSFYFGVLPVLSMAAKAMGIPPTEVAQAALLGLHTTGFPVSPLTPATYLVVGLAGVELREHQKFSIPYLYAASLVMTAAALAIGVLHF
jgi:CitMHS family citrate-Mg2+:H+ or citrate-Ca2+:H+ symporter